MLYRYSARPVANGLRTDHPIPDLPFVNDEHIPVTDPVAIEAIGRNREEGMWGREDPGPDRVGWLAFTTDPTRHDLAWCVRWHPEYGRSVVLYRDEDASDVHMAWWGSPLLFRAGGYWWDGAEWYRPLQVWDPASESFVNRPVPAATAISAADLLSGRGDPAGGRILTLEDIDTAVPPERWIDDLALWAQRRSADDLPLQQSVVTVSAPELTGDQLVGATQLAEVAGIAPATLRAYISRGEADVPLPQATISGRSMWSRPVAEEWAEQRQRSPEALRSSVGSARNQIDNPVGITELWELLTQWFYTRLWERDYRKRWTLRWRNPAAVRELAESLAWTVAAGLRRLIPMPALGVTIRHALLNDLADGQKLYRSTRSSGKVRRIDNDIYYGLAPQVTQMLDWLIRHDPSLAAHVIGETIGEAEQELGIPRSVTEYSLRSALHLDGHVKTEQLDDFLDRVFTPTGGGE